MKKRIIEGVEEALHGSDNMFADLGLADAKKLKIKPAKKSLGHLLLAAA